jgi:excisionase family DNA binding protein
MGVPDGRRYLSVRQVREATGVSATTVYGWVRDGLPVVRIGQRGRKLLVRAEALDAYLAERERRDSHIRPPRGRRR